MLGRYHKIIFPCLSTTVAGLSTAPSLTILKSFSSLVCWDWWEACKDPPLTAWANLLKSHSIATRLPNQFYFDADWKRLQKKLTGVKKGHSNCRCKLGQLLASKSLRDLSLAWSLIQFDKISPEIFSPHPEKLSKSENAEPKKYLGFCIFCADKCAPWTRWVVATASPRILLRQERMEIHSSSSVDMVDGWRKFLPDNQLSVSQAIRAIPDAVILCLFATTNLVKHMHKSLI